MTVRPSPYEIIRAIQDQQRATDRLVAMLVGMLDKSSPDPILSGFPLQEGEVRLAALPARPRRATDEGARPPVVMMIDGVEFKTTKRRAALLSAVMAAPLTLSAMSRQGIAPTVAGVKAQIIDTNRDLEKAGITRRVRMQALPAQRLGARGGREPALYALLSTEDLAPASDALHTRADDNPPTPAAEPTPDAGGIPAATHEESHVDRSASAQPIADPDESVMAPGNGHTCEVDTEFGQPPGAGTGSAVGTGAPDSPLSSAQPPSAAEASPPAGTKRPPAAQPAAAARTKPKPAAKMASAPIEPGDLISVDIKQKRIQTKAGAYEVAGANLARALDKLRGGDLFGLDTIAKVAGWPSAEVARTALGFERKRLANHGLDLFMDKFNVRLREVA